MQNSSYNSKSKLYCGFPKLSIPPMEWISPMTPPPLWKSNLVEIFGPLNPPPSVEFPIPSVGGVWIFSGTTHSWFISS